MDIKEIELYKEEIWELTNLLRMELFDIKELLNESWLDVEKIFLIWYFEDEEETEYGIIFTNEIIIQFEIYNKKVSLKDITDLEGIENEFPQIKVAKDYL